MGLLDEIDPAACATEARRRFSPRRMAEGYLKIYRQAEAAVPELEWKVIEKAPPSPHADRLCGDYLLSGLAAAFHPVEELIHCRDVGLTLFDEREVGALLEDGELRPGHPAVHFRHVRRRGLVEPAAGN